MVVRKWEKQTVRIGGQLLSNLQKLQRQTPFSFSEMARKGVRKYRRLQPDLSAIEPDSTYTGSVIRFELEYRLAPEDLRKILTWYISLQDLNNPFYTVPGIPETVAILRHQLKTVDNIP